MNWFVYCGNNPLSKTDPTGLWVPIGAQNAMGDSADDQRQYRAYRDEVRYSNEGYRHQQNVRSRGPANSSSFASLFWPISQGIITTVFGPTTPIIGNNGVVSNTFHYGIDVAVSVGTSVNSVGDGLVVQAGVNGNYGNSVTIILSNGFTIINGHLSALSVSVGEKVVSGENIGQSGNTGLSSGPHLHFEVILGDIEVDPLSVLPCLPQSIGISLRYILIDPVTGGLSNAIQ